MRIAVLAYHAQNCNGGDYANNDHIALQNDLSAIHSANIPLLPLADVVEAIILGTTDTLPNEAVCLTCDDGTSLDWKDYEHPLHGPQKSLANILREYLSELHSNASAQRSPEQRRNTAGMLSAFVIASKTARKAIDEGCYEGLPLSADDWWSEAASEGLVAIENHGWDHLHPVIPKLDDPCCEKGSFYSVKSYASADLQVRRAAQTINATLNATPTPTKDSQSHQCRLFAYPFGHCADYLKDDYFPQYGTEHGMKAAFTTVPDYLTEQTNLFAAPRFVCGNAWNSAAQFQDILAGLRL